jgi:hypothetical protein
MEGRGSVLVKAGSAYYARVESGDLWVKRVGRQWRVLYSFTAPGGGRQWSTLGDYSTRGGALEAARALLEGSSSVEVTA